MVSKKQIIMELLKASKTVKNPDAAKAASELDTLKGAVISYESDAETGLKSGLQNASTLSKITNDSENALASAMAKISMEGGETFNPTVAQRHAMVAAAKYVGSKDSIMKTISLLGENPSSISTVDGRSVSFESIDLRHVVNSQDIKNLVPSLESFDPQRIENSVRYSMTVNFLCSRQDEFGEAFFPTITVDTVNSGFRMDVELYDFVSDFVREIDGSLDDDKFNRRSLVKAQYDNELLLKDYNKVYPIFRKGTNDAEFLANYTWTERVGDEIVTTAPLTVGQKHNLLALSQTDKTLATGLYTNTDSLDRRIELKHLYLQVQGQDAQGADVTEVFRLNTEGIANAIFQATQTGHSKDLTINFTSRVLGLNTSKSLTVEDSVSKILDSLADNHSIELEITANGSANTETGTVVLYGNAVSLRNVRNSDGKVLDVNSEAYKAVKAALAKVSLIGYDLNAGRTNTNLRTRGQRLEINRYTEVYPIPVRSDINVELPIDVSQGDQTDAALVEAQVTAIGAYCSAHAVDTLIRTADKLREMKANGTLVNVDRYEGLTIGRYRVDGYYYSETVDVAAQMDSRESNKRFEDVQRYIIDKLYNVVVDMAVESKYLQAFKQAYGKDGNAQINVVIGTDPSIAKFLLCACEGNVLTLGGNYKAIVVETPNPRVKGKMFVSFTILDENRNTTVNDLNFGQMLWSPAIVLDLAKPEGNAYTRTVRSIPRYWHQVNLPIIAEFTIADTKNAFNKNTIQFKQV